MHKNPVGRDNQARERGPHNSQEQVTILKELATLIAAQTTRGRPSRASVAVQQCMTQFGLYSDFKMTPQEVNKVANLPEWTKVLEVMIKSRRADLAFRTTKPEWWNQRAQDKQAHKDFLEQHRGTTKDFLEQHRGTTKFTGKYAQQPQQTELIWPMPWGCWVELEDKDVHCKEKDCTIENFTEEEADTTVHPIYGQRAILSVNYKSGDWESVRAWILKVGSGWHQAETAEDPQNMNKFTAGSLGAVTAHRIKWILSG